MERHKLWLLSPAEGTRAQILILDLHMSRTEQDDCISLEITDSIIETGTGRLAAYEMEMQLIDSAHSRVQAADKQEGTGRVLFPLNID